MHRKKTKDISDEIRKKDYIIPTIILAIFIVLVKILEG